MRLLDIDLFVCRQRHNVTSSLVKSMCSTALAHMTVTRHEAAFARRRRLAMSRRIHVATAAERSGAYCMSLPTICSIALCSLAPARRPKTAAGIRIWPLPMLDRRGNMGTPAGGYHHAYSIEQSTYVLFPFCFLHSLFGW